MACEDAATNASGQLSEQAQSQPQTLMVDCVPAARIYNKHLGDDHTGREPVQEMTLNKGDITWFSPNWFQTHQLENTTQDFCCTVQGFQYADDDDVHWPYMQFKVGLSPSAWQHLCL